jgi:hypothetical protein
MSQSPLKLDEIFEATPLCQGGKTADAIEID